MIYTSAEENKALVHCFIEEIVNKGNMAVADEIFAEDFVLHIGRGTFSNQGPEVPKKVFTILRTGFPDLNLTIDDMISEGDKIAVRFSGNGTHKGEFMGVPPTGKKVFFSVIDIFRFVGGKIAEVWSILDMLDVWEQISAQAISPYGDLLLSQ